MFKLGAGSLLDHYTKRKGYLIPYADSRDAGAIFRKIYASRGWVHSETQESLSGPGSSLAATSGLFSAVVKVMDMLGCRSLVDVGCGDWNWMSKEDIQIAYTGVDIVREVIENNSRYSRENVKFLVCDATQTPLPRADMALCREILFHLSFNDAMKVLSNIRQTSPYICATTDTANWFNSDIKTGGFRLLNLFRAPFNFPDPVYLINDSAISSGRFLGVWRSDQFTVK